MGMGSPGTGQKHLLPWLFCLIANEPVAIDEQRVSRLVCCLVDAQIQMNETDQCRSRGVLATPPPPFWITALGEAGGAPRA